MNKVLFICILMIGCLSGQAQAIKTSDVPSVVTAALKKEYPYATNIKWEIQDGMYEASFKWQVEDGMQDGSPRIVKGEMSVIYSDQGIMALIETPVDVSTLPANVLDYFRKNLITATITEASKFVDSQGITSYEVEVDKTDYFFTANGQFLRKQAD